MSRAFFRPFQARPGHCDITSDTAPLGTLPPTLLSKDSPPFQGRFSTSITSCVAGLLGNAKFCGAALVARLTACSEPRPGHGSTMMLSSGHANQSQRAPPAPRPAGCTACRAPFRVTVQAASRLPHLPPPGTACLRPDGPVAAGRRPGSEINTTTVSRAAVRCWHRAARVHGRI